MTQESSSVHSLPAPLAPVLCQVDPAPQSPPYPALTPHQLSQASPLLRISLPACRPTALNPVRAAQANLENKAKKTSYSNWPHSQVARGPQVGSWGLKGSTKALDEQVSPTQSSPPPPNPTRITQGSTQFPRS